MKKTIIISLGLMAILFSCKQKTQDNNVPESIMLCKNIEYDVVVNNYRILASNFESGIEDFYTSKDDFWFIYNIETSVRLPFVDLIFKKALSGELETTDVSGNPLNTQNIRELLISNDSVTYQRMVPPYDLFDTIIEVKNFEVNDITAFRFREEWTYNPQTMAIYKKVLAMAPVVSPDKGNSNINIYGGTGKPLFWIKFSEEKPATEVLTKRILNQMPIFGEDEQKALNADTVIIQKYLTALYSKIKSDSITVYYSSFNGAEFENIPENGKETAEKIVSLSQENKPITDLRFLEEWTFDPNTMYLQKKVVGFCPVAKDYNDRGELRGLLPMFWVYFNEIWMPYQKSISLCK